MEEFLHLPIIYSHPSSEHSSYITVCISEVNGTEEKAEVPFKVD